MTRKRWPAVPGWSLVLPFAACLVLAAAWGRPLGWAWLSLVALITLTLILPTLAITTPGPTFSP